MDSRIGAAVVAVLLGCLGWYLMLTGDGDEPSRSKNAASEVTSQGPQVHPALVVRGDVKKSVKSRAKAEPSSRQKQQAKRKDVVVQYTGAVLDHHQRPVEDVSISIKFRGEVVEELKTDHLGKYTFRRTVTPLEGRFGGGTVIARGLDGAVGYETFRVHSISRLEESNLLATSTIAPIQLGAPGLTINIHVQSVCKGALPARVWLVYRGRYSRRDDILAVDTTNDAGHVAFEGIGVGHYRVVASAPGCGRDSALVSVVADGDAFATLTIPEERRLTVHVKDRRSGTPIFDARVTAQERVQHPKIGGTFSFVSARSIRSTNKQGNAVFTGLGAHEELSIHVFAPGYPPVYDASGKAKQRRNIVAPGVTEYEIAFDPPRTVRWDVKDGGSGVPPNGITAKISPIHGSSALQVPSQGTITNGQLVVERWPAGEATARATVRWGNWDSGRKRQPATTLVGSALLRVGPDSDVGDAIAFDPQRRIEFRIKHANGRSAEGLFVIAKGANQPMLRTTVTNKDGWAVIEGLPGDEESAFACYASYSSNPQAGWKIADVELHDGDRTVEFVVPAKRVLRVRVTLDGKVPPVGFRVPALWTLRPSVRMNSGVSNRVELEPNRVGECQVEVVTHAKAKAVSLSVLHKHAQQVRPCGASLEGSDDVSLNLVLATSYRAQVHVKQPADGVFQIASQRWDKRTSEWSRDTLGMWPSQPKKTDAIIVMKSNSLLPGRYRVIDTLTGILGSEFHLGPKHLSASSTIDLTKSGWIKGRVVAPRGVSLRETTVDAIEGRTSVRKATQSNGFARARGVYVNPTDGTFSYRVAKGDSVTLRPFHPALRPHSTRGHVLVRGPKTGLELHLEMSGKATLWFDAPLHVAQPLGRSPKIDVVLTPKSKPGQKISLVAHVNATRDGLDFGGYVPGQYDVWIDTLTAMPLVLRGVELTDGVTNLGRHKLNYGSSLRMRMEGNEQPSPRFMALRATSLFPPFYTRASHPMGKELALTGLSAGRFRVVFHRGRGVPEFDEIIEFDGKTDVERKIEGR